MEAGGGAGAEGFLGFLGEARPGEVVLDDVGEFEGGAEAKGEGPTASQLKSNRMMQQRIFFQALAITVVVLLLFMAGRT